MMAFQDIAKVFINELTYDQVSVGKKLRLSLLARPSTSATRTVVPLILHHIPFIMLRKALYHPVPLWMWTHPHQNPRLYLN